MSLYGTHISTPSQMDFLKCHLGIVPKNVTPYVYFNTIEQVFGDCF